MMLAAPKPFASLSSGLLARKGQARPAMRRQLATLDIGAHAGDDLGWNDMGEPLPPVLAQREELEESFAATEGASELRHSASAMPTGARRAAFTLRLDAERHLRLRLASATRGVSAQKLVTQALDDLLKTMPGLESLRAGASSATRDPLGN